MKKSIRAQKLKFIAQNSTTMPMFKPELQWWTHCWYPRYATSSHLSKFFIFFVYPPIRLGVMDFISVSSKLELNGSIHYGFVGGQGQGTSIPQSLYMDCRVCFWLCCNTSSSLLAISHQKNPEFTVCFCFFIIFC